MHLIRSPSGKPLRFTDTWRRVRASTRAVGVAYLALAAFGKLRYALPHLLRDVEPWSGLDVRYRFEEVTTWFSGAPVYGVVGSAVYPPATHVILWPLVGWGSVAEARWAWAVTILGSAAALAFLVHRLAAPAPVRDRLLLTGLVFAAYPLSTSVMVGQLGVHVAALVAWGAFLLTRSPERWSTDIVAAVLLAGALVKPTVAIPLVVVACIISARARPALLVGAIYAALTGVAVAAQPSGPVALVRDWLQRASVRVPFEFGVPNLHMALWWAGLGPWMTPASLLALAIAAWWAWPRRGAPPWVLIGVAAIVTRLWAHSTPFDDAFLLFPALALFQIAFGPPSRERRAAGWLFAGSWAALLTPNWMLFNVPPVVTWGVNAAQTLFWLTVLVFLVLFTERHAPEGTPEVGRPAAAS